MLFLAETAETHNGPERPSDLLNGDADFVVVELCSGEIAFLNRNCIVRVAVALDDEVSPVDSEVLELIDDGAVDVRIAVRLDNGYTVEGIAHYVLPEANRRIQDFLNGEASFVAIRHGDEVELVNKRRIIRVIQLES